jgi:hypothetical protein
LPSFGRGGSSPFAVQSAIRNPQSAIVLQVPRRPQGAAEHPVGLFIAKDALGLRIELDLAAEADRDVPEVADWNGAVPSAVVS